MRNWNFRIPPIRNHPKFGFQTTYEELKQEQLDKANSNVIGFQTTYEELKLFL